MDEQTNEVVERLLCRYSGLKKMWREEMALQREGRGDTLNRFILHEEILCVRTRLADLHVSGFYKERMVTPHTRRSLVYSGKNGAAVDDNTCYFEHWKEQNSADNSSEHAIMLDVVANSDTCLSSSQAGAMKQCVAGRGVRAVARETGKAASTVSRTLSRAKKGLREQADNIRRIQNRVEDQEISSLDMYLSQSGILFCIPQRLILYQTQHHEATMEEMQDIAEHMKEGGAIFLTREDIQEISTDSQMKVFNEWACGQAGTLGVNKSTVSRTLQRVSNGLAKSVRWWRDEPLLFLCLQNRKFLPVSKPC